MIDANPWLHDPKCLPIPWREVSPAAKLKLGVMFHDGVVLPTPPVARALREAVAKLKAAGHEVVNWEPIGHSKGHDLLLRMFYADGGKSVRMMLDPVSEPFRPEMDSYRTAEELGVYDMWQLQIERTQFCKDYLDRWNAAGLDGLICPTTPYATVPHGGFKYVGYTGIFNVLDYSAVSFPTGIKVDKDLDAHFGIDTKLSAVHPDYDAESVHGLPISLQLVARRLEEEKVLAMTDTVLAAL